MKITTANIKSPQYTENHEIYIGTHTGSFKRICVSDQNPYKQINLQSISALNKSSRITSLNWGADNDEILIGRTSEFVKVYDSHKNEFTSNVKMTNGPIVGVARYDGSLVVGIENGQIQILNDSETILSTGDHMSRMRQCPIDKKLIATGGKGRQNNLKVWNLEEQKQMFSAKNLPNDYLQLEVPVWDSDMSFINQNELGVCSRFGYVRTYDIRQQRRPVLSFASKTDEQVAYTCLTSYDRMLYVGMASGIVRAFDSRKMKTIVHTYKGFTGSISDVRLDASGKFLFTTCLDRFVRVYCSDSTVLLYQCYVKSKPTQILVKDAVAANIDDDCHLIENVDESVEINRKDVKTKTQKNLVTDPEFDALFDNMQTVDEDESNAPAPPPKKRKSINIKQSNKKNRK